MKGIGIVIADVVHRTVRRNFVPGISYRKLLKVVHIGTVHYLNVDETERDGCLIFHSSFHTL
jgi:hypothetical protein